MARINTALVIGGGIAGPATALALRKAGIEPVIYEAYPSPSSGVGAALTVAPNGMNALALIGADQDVCRIGQPIRSIVMADGRGKQLVAFSGLAGLPASQALSRDELSCVLHNRTVAEGITTEFGKRLVGVDDKPEGITARFSDGSTAAGDLLIGADGINSVVRKLIDANAPGPQYDGLLGFGGAAELDVPGEPDAMYFVFGRRAFFGYWRQPDGRTAWFSNLPRSEPLSTSQARETPPEDWLAQLSDVYAEDVPARDLLRRTPAADLYVLGAMDMLPPVPRWHRGRMVLVGDSAHAPNHSSGQGASLALESALELARCLRDVDGCETAFLTYEALRRPRVTRIAAEAAKTNRRKAAGPIAGALMSLLLPIAMKTFMTPEKMFGWVQSYRVDWDAPVAAQVRRHRVPATANRVEHSSEKAA